MIWSQFNYLHLLLFLASCPSRQMCWLGHTASHLPLCFPTPCPLPGLPYFLPMVHTDMTPFSWAADTRPSSLSCYFSLILSSHLRTWFGSGFASLELKLSHLSYQSQCSSGCIRLCAPPPIDHTTFLKIATINGYIHYHILRSISYLLLHNKLTYI